MLCDVISYVLLTVLVLLFYYRCSVQVFKLNRADGWNISCQCFEQEKVWCCAVCISVSCDHDVMTYVLLIVLLSGRSCY